jgi:hypothetical protein
MNWHELLDQQIDDSYNVAERLIKLLDEKDLAWKPSETNNWMTTAQLLLHLGRSCGVPMKGFATGQWDMPVHHDINTTKTSMMPPPAEKLKAVQSIDEALELLAIDRKLAHEAVNVSSENDLASKATPAPWDPRPLNLGHRLLLMIDHFNQHKAQLFYYLKLQGKPVNTRNLFVR